jgi:hypothetical protein
VQRRPATSPDARSSAANGVPAGATGRAALLATFYVDQEEGEVTEGLRKLLCRGLNLEQERPGTWRTPNGEGALLLRFDPRAAPDATVLQVALNAQGEAGKAWETSREQLEKWLTPKALDGIWGYTLTYQANLNPGSDLEETFKKLRPAARLLHAGKGRPYGSLARADAAGGRIWLMAVPTEDKGPTEGEGPAAGTVYVALGEAEKERDLGKVFLGNGAKLLMPELIAHKSYYQRRKYRGKRYEEYKQRLDEFRDLVRSLLNELEQREVRPEELTELTRELTRRYHGLAEMVWQLEDVRVSMARQLHNYDEWEMPGDNDILQYHRHHIETTNVELELLVSDGQYALSVADPVLSMSRYRAERAQDKEEALRQHRMQALLAIVAAALGLPALVPILESFAGNAFVEFLAQIVRIASVALVIALLAIPIWFLARFLWSGVRRFLSRRRKSDGSEDC